MPATAITNIAWLSCPALPAQISQMVLVNPSACPCDDMSYAGAKENESPGFNFFLNAQWESVSFGAAACQRKEDAGSQPASQLWLSKSSLFAPQKRKTQSKHLKRNGNSNARGPQQGTKFSFMEITNKEEKKNFHGNHQEGLVKVQAFLLQVSHGYFVTERCYFTTALAHVKCFIYLLVQWSEMEITVATCLNCYLPRGCNLSHSMTNHYTG